MIHWNSGLEMGVESIDTEHKEMLEYINTLYESIQENNSLQQKTEIYDQFLHLASKHSKSEEEILKKCKCATLDKHQYYHKIFKEELHSLKYDFLQASSLSEAQKFCFTLTDLLLNHIVEEDIPLIRELQLCGLIALPKEDNSFVSKLIYKITNSFGFTKRILLSALIPMFAMLFFISILIADKYNHYQELLKTSNIVYLLPDINELVHSMQVERGLSCGYLSSNNKNSFTQRLDHQKKVVEQDIVHFQNKLQQINLDKITPISQNINKFKSDISLLKDFRSKVAMKQVTFEETIAFYTKIINNIINITPKMTLFNLNKEISLSISSLNSLLRYKETLGLKRARGTTVIEMKASSKQGYIAFIELNGVQKMLRESFQQSATDKNIKKLQKIIISKTAQKILFYENHIIDKEFSKLDPVVWFREMTLFINEVKLLEDNLLEEISSAVRENLYNEKRDLFLMISTTLLTFIIVLFIIYILQQSSKREILKYTDAIQHLSEGDRNLRLSSIMAKDEMAQMYNAYERTRQKLLKGEIYTQLYLSEKEREIKRKEKEAQMLKEMAYHDPLTGVLNRRKFDELSQIELKRAKRYSKKLSFLMLDIDHFKAINDTYGHSIGDEVLKAFATTCLNMARELDIVARIGGEEFVVMLLETDAEGAYVFAERFRKAIEEFSVNVEGHSIKFTVSIGIATFDITQENQSIKSLLEEADKALYEAKETGRNQTKISK